jgi:DNA-directed RNA polymerase subunit RPC12/RpoP
VKEEYMPFKCALCGLSFETPDDFVKHKLAHQEQQERPEKKGLTCLRCGKAIPTDSYGSSYRGVIACPDCRQTMKIVMVNGEIEFAMSQGGADQTKEGLLNQYRKWVLEYTKVRDLIESLVPVTALSEGGKMPAITVTEDLLAKFKYAETTMVAALREIEQIHEKLHRI